MSELGFYVLATLTVVAASGVVVLRNPVHSAMSLVGALFLIAVCFTALEAHLVAALQIIVYAGAVMVLFLFVIMLLNLQAEPARETGVGLKLVGIAAAAAVALLLAFAVTTSPNLTGAAGPASSSKGFGTTQALARVLFREHVVAFELTSLLLLVAIVGAVVLARRDRA